MGNGSSKKKYFYIWVDSNINNLENTEYSIYLNKKYPNICIFNNIEEAINYFLKIKFHITYIIVSGSLFKQFILKLKKEVNKISTVPKIIIFTSEFTKQQIKNIDLINDSFYNIGGLVTKFENVLSFLKKNAISQELNFEPPLRREKMQTGGEFSFELLDNKTDFIGIIYLTRLFKEPNKENCKYFDKYLIDNYGDIMKELISQIYNINCPNLLRVKFWLRAYTLESKYFIKI